MWLLEQPEEKFEYLPPKFDQAADRKTNQERAILLIQSFDGVAEGGRNDQLNRIAFAAIQGMAIGDDPVVFAAIREWNQKNSPPLPEKELRSTWKSALKARPANAGFLAEVPREIDKKGLVPAPKADKKPEPQNPSENLAKVQETASDYLQEQRVRMERELLCGCSDGSGKAMLLGGMEMDSLTDPLAIAVYQAIKRALMEGLNPSLAVIRHLIAETNSTVHAKNYEEFFNANCCDLKTVDELESLVQIIKSSAMRGKLLRFFEKSAIEVQDPKKTTLELQDSLTVGLAKSFSTSSSSEPIHERFSVNEAMVEQEQIEYDKQHGKTIAYKTGIGSLDRALDPGIRPGEYLLIVASSGFGKSALAAQIADKISESGPFLYFPFEITHKEMSRRAACRHFGKEQSQLRSSHLAQYEELAKGIYYEDKVEPEADAVLQSILLFFARFPNAVGVAIDHISLIFKRKSSQKEAMEYFSGKFKRLLNRYEKVGIVCQQENTGPYERAKSGKLVQPLPVDNRDSQQMHHDCDKQLTIWRPHRFRPSEPKDLVELHMLKNRQGPCTIPRATSELWCYRFADREPAKPTPRGEQRSLLDEVNMEDVP